MQRKNWHSRSGVAHMEFDHFAVAGMSLDAATAHTQDALGVGLVPGGQHALFGTHNRLLGLEDGLYLEAIAIDPDAADPGRARWFDLDRFEGAPRISNWIARVDDLDATLAALPLDIGEPVRVTRGALQWRMAVPGDGILPFDGAFPALIQWECDTHPADMLPVSGCRLRRFTVSHPEAEGLQELLGPRLSDARVRIETGPVSALSAEFDTPSGRRVLQ